MNLNVILAKRENEVTECIAWGGSYKETASLLQISVRTVDNTLRKVKEKLGLNKINEISAWWFCTHHNISLDLSQSTIHYLIKIRIRSASGKSPVF